MYGDTQEHRYAPLAEMATFYPPHLHPWSPIRDDIGALELRNGYRVRWYGCERAYINAELRLVVVGHNSRDEVRATWKKVAKKNRIGT